jgi:hypothetical protein
VSPTEIAVCAGKVTIECHIIEDDQLLHIFFSSRSC